MQTNLVMLMIKVIGVNYGRHPLQKIG